MPLKLIPPRKGKSPNFTIRGTYLGVYIERSAGTGVRALAARVLAKIKRDIETGAVTSKTRERLTFAGAATDYMKAGGEARFLTPIIEHFTLTPVDEITQGAIDRAATKIYPDATPATRNRQVYSPVSAVLRHAGIKLALKRPKGAQGVSRNRWLWPEQAFAVIEAATATDKELGILLELLLYTGERLSPPLVMRCDELRLSENFCFIRDTKNGDPRPVHLPKQVVAALKRHPRGIGRGEQRVFRFTKGSAFYKLLRAATGRASRETRSDLSWVTPHVFCHTYGTWMRRYGGLDVIGLVATGRWKDPKSAARYTHTVVSEESRKADLLPRPKRKRA